MAWYEIIGLILLIPILILIYIVLVMMLIDFIKDIYLELRKVK